MAARASYGKIDRSRERDIMADTGKSKGRMNNPGDFGNGNDGTQGVDNVDRAAVDRRKRNAAARSKPRRSRQSHPYPA